MSLCRWQAPTALSVSPFTRFFSFDVFSFYQLRRPAGQPSTWNRRWRIIDIWCNRMWSRVGLCLACHFRYLRPVLFLSWACLTLAMFSSPADIYLSVLGGSQPQVWAHLQVPSDPDLDCSLPWADFAISNSGERGKRWHVPQSVDLLRRHGLPMFHIPHPSPSLLYAQASRLGTLTEGRSVTLDSASVGSIQSPCLWTRTLLSSVREIIATKNRLVC